MGAATRWLCLPLVCCGQARQMCTVVRGSALHRLSVPSCVMFCVCVCASLCRFLVPDLATTTCRRGRGPEEGRHIGLARRSECTHRRSRERVCERAPRACGACAGGAAAVNMTKL